VGFELLRVSGSHHVFIHPEVREILSLQNAGGEAKPHQIRQFFRLVERYDLKVEKP
jgi:predicted RNA binding protein YcfA (HicA-like mRNA interferase family)